MKEIIPIELGEISDNVNFLKYVMKTVGYFYKKDVEKELIGIFNNRYTTERE